MTEWVACHKDCFYLFCDKFAYFKINMGFNSPFFLTVDMPLQTHSMRPGSLLRSSQFRLMGLVTSFNANREPWPLEILKFVFKNNMNNAVTGQLHMFSGCDR